MKLELQVTSLSLSKKLKELEVKQESLFAWYPNPLGFDRYSLEKVEAIDLNREPISAFTVAELGEMLPEMIRQEGNPRFLYETKFHDEWLVQYWRGTEALLKQFDETEANSRAKMLVYLIENKFIKP